LSSRRQDAWVRSRESRPLAGSIAECLEQDDKRTYSRPSQVSEPARERQARRNPAREPDERAEHEGRRQSEIQIGSTQAFAVCFFSTYATNSYSQRLKPLFSLLSALLNEIQKPGKNINNPLSSCRRLDRQHPPTSNVQFITDALADYVKEIGIDLFKNPFVAMLGRSNSLEAIPQLLQGRERVFTFLTSLRSPSWYSLKNEYRDGNWKLINCLSSTVKVHHAFSDFHCEAASLVSRACHIMDLHGNSFNLTSSDPFPQATVSLTGAGVLLEVCPLNMLFDWIRGHTLEPRSDSDWSRPTSVCQPPARLDESSTVFHPFSPLFVAPRPSLFPRPPAQDTANKSHRIQPSWPPLSHLFLPRSTFGQ